KHTYAPFVIATTHQLYRFVNAFDVMIVDEVDAFPYSMDATLQRAVQVARKEISATVYVTATPNKLWQYEVKRGKRHATMIPARYHGHPLPVPQFHWCGNYKKMITKGKLPICVMKWIDTYLLKKPIMLFVPHIDMLHQ